MRPGGGVAASRGKSVSMGRASVEPNPTRRASSKAQAVGAWTAGVVDSDGCVSIKRNGPYYYVSVVVAQSGEDSPMLHRLRSEFGGSISRRKKRPGKSSPSYSWQVVGLDAHRLLRRISPYLLLKRDQALLAMKFRDFVGRAGLSLTDAQRCGQRALHQAIAEAKKDGPDVEQARMMAAALPEPLFEAWVAGLVDGDGCIGIRVSQGRYFTERVSVGQPVEGRGLLELLAEIFGGSVALRRRKNRPDFYQWDIHGPRASAMLKRVAPHLLQKQKQSALVLQYRETVERSQKRRTEDVIHRQRSLYEEARALNRHGTRPVIATSA